MEAAKDPSLLALAATGFALGWNLAWVPGPINAEMLRRGAARGFWAAFVVGAGASSADFLWALAAAAGAGALASRPGVQSWLAATSALLLVGLAVLFLRGAWRSWREWRGPRELATHPTVRRPGEEALESRRGGYALGFLTAATSPYNMSFWVAAAAGQAARGAGGMLLYASSVVAGTTAWCVVLCTASRYGARLPGPALDAALRALAAGFLLWIGGRSAMLLLPGG